MTRTRWIAAVLAASAMMSGAACSTDTSGGGGADPRQMISSGAESLVSGGSARVRAAFSFPGSQGPGLTSDGVISWQGAGGTTGDLTVPAVIGGQPARSLFTGDALYLEAGSLGPGFPGLAGKKWIKQSYADVARDLGPLGQVLTAAIDQTNPVRSAALLVQSPDLREVGEEPINGVTATHYSGTIRFTDAVEDLRLGLSGPVLDELRREIAATGESDVQQYDLWVDDQGRPVRAQGRAAGRTGPESYSIDYTDYSGPRPVSAPPGGEVIDKDQMLQGIGGN